MLDFITATTTTTTTTTHTPQCGGPVKGVLRLSAMRRTVVLKDEVLDFVEGLVSEQDRAFVVGEFFVLPGHQVYTSGGRPSAGAISTNPLQGRDGAQAPSSWAVGAWILMLKTTVGGQTVVFPHHGFIGEATSVSFTGREGLTARKPANSGEAGALATQVAQEGLSFLFGPAPEGVRIEAVIDGADELERRLASYGQLGTLPMNAHMGAWGGFKSSLTRSTQGHASSPAATGRIGVVHNGRTVVRSAPKGPKSGGRVDQAALKALEAATAAAAASEAIPY